MSKRKGKVRSVTQRNLMGYAYACATGKVDNCPTKIKKVAKSFTNKKKGLSILKKMAKTKHKGLPLSISESSVVLKFNYFILKEGLFDDDDDSSDVVAFLYSLSDHDINSDMNDFLTAGDKEMKKEYIEDIIKTIQRRHKNITKEKADWVEETLKKRTIEDAKRKYK